MSAGNGRASTATLARKPARVSSRMDLRRSAAAAAAAPTDRARMSKVIEEFRHAWDPNRGIDALVVQPVEAMKLCADVARTVELVTPAEWNAFTAALGVFEMQHAAFLTAINTVCRAAMNGRKRGKHKPTKSQRKGGQE